MLSSWVAIQILFCFARAEISCRKKTKKAYYSIWLYAWFHSLCIKLTGENVFIIADKFLHWLCVFRFVILASLSLYSNILYLIKKKKEIFFFLRMWFFFDQIHVSCLALLKQTSRFKWDCILDALHLWGMKDKRGEQTFTQGCLRLYLEAWFRCISHKTHTEAHAHTLTG